MASIVIACFLISYILFDDSSEIARLKSELERVNSMLAQAEAGAKRSRNDNQPMGYSKRIALQQQGALQDSDQDGVFGGMSQADLDRTFELNRRSKEGEYILGYERPTDQLLRRWGISNYVANVTSTNAVYGEVFERLGLSEKSSKQFQKHLGKIISASMEADTAIQQLLSARKAYDNRLQSELGPEEYRVYREFEESKRAGAEVQRLQDYVQSTFGDSIDPNHSGTIADLIRESEAYTGDSWNGPYDGLPEPAVGKHDIIERLENMINQIGDRAQIIAGRAAEAGVSQEGINLTYAYYTKVLDEKRRMIETVRNFSP
ncbi:MAG: hypothetical protein K9N62_07810 [Verrucomicrobia bacterium]|nr:hypothetical protein [Verrucomicrobiota bacterium]